MKDKVCHSFKERLVMFSKIF